VTWKRHPGVTLQGGLFASFLLSFTTQRFAQNLDIATQEAEKRGPAERLEDPLFVIHKRLSMTSRSWARIRKGAGMTLMLAGLLFWILAVVLPLTPLHVGLLASLGHIEKQSLGVIAGGASVVGGIVFFLARSRRRRRRYM
jgi:hypothetical protein